MYYLLYGFLYLVSLLPFWVLHGISDGIAALVFHVVGYRKKIVLNNLKIAFPEKTEQERNAIAKEFYRRMFDTFLEGIKILSIPEKQLRKRAIMDAEVLNALAAKGKNIQFMGGHQMNWEYAAQASSFAFNIPIIGVYMRIANQAVDRIFKKIRGRPNIILVSKDEFVARRGDVFNRQYAIGLVADQNPTKPEKAYWLNFFGKAAPFIPGPDKAARKFNSAVIFYKFVQVKRGYYRYIPTLIAEDGNTLSEGELTRKFRDFLEETIRQDPANYLWSHRRWKFDYNEQYHSLWIDNEPPK